ncbi:flavodoxin [Gordonibacter sp. 28C]|uniref:EFR1 family ferrodoxin n=1 Tax=Gordonibacter sp. 28C TaxID=2078569 RepID=UPI000DF79199|nr:EFR1 family ferrodoxin [Gordonibacter sp. 28C]RDB61928.1 flavodoxin [Gordonibacter sp. 28C]
MILYFSGTGNSRWAARRLAEKLDDELVSINAALKGGASDGGTLDGGASREGAAPAVSSHRPLVFVTPTYAWRMPRVVARWIDATRFEGNRDAYFVLTCGGSVGNAAAYAKRLCVKRGLRFRGLAPVIMPDNYVALYETPDAATCEALMAGAGPQIEKAAALIADDAPLPEPPVDFKARLRSGPVNALFYPALVHDKAFAATDACTSCGACARRCPLGNIALVGGHPVWQGACTHCMACIGGCPTRAIEYGEKTKARRRYCLEDVTGA